MNEVTASTSPPRAAPNQRRLRRRLTRRSSFPTTARVADAGGGTRRRHRRGRNLLPAQQLRLSDLEQHRRDLPLRSPLFRRRRRLDARDGRRRARPLSRCAVRGRRRVRLRVHGRGDSVAGRDPLALAAAAAIGCLSALITIYLHVPPLIATLGTFFVVQGSVTVLTGGNDVFTGIPPSFDKIGQSTVGESPTSSSSESPSASYAMSCSRRRRSATT